MLDWLLKKGQDSFKNELQIKVDECADRLDLSLKYYYKNHFKDNITGTQKNKTGIERFYLFMCASFGYLADSFNKISHDEELMQYFLEYVPLRLPLKFDQEIGLKVFNGFDFNYQTNYEGLKNSFGYAGAMVTNNECPLSRSAARTGGHMLWAYSNNKTTIPAEGSYSEFRKKGSLFRDGDRSVHGLQLIFDNKDLQMHKLKIT